MTSLFMPAFFQAHSGTVHFLGQPLSGLTAMRAKTALLKASIDAPFGSRLEAVYHLAKEQAEKAIREARVQSTNIHGQTA